MKLKKAQKQLQVAIKVNPSCDSIPIPAASGNKKRGEFLKQSNKNKGECTPP